MKIKTTYIISIAYLVLCSCSNNGKTEHSKQSSISNKIDTISCGNNQGLIDVKYYNNNREIQYLPINDTFSAVFTFNGNFKNILEKGEFNIEIDNDSLSTVTKTGANKFDFFIDSRINHYNSSLEVQGLQYWQILQAPNTIFEWSWSANGILEYEYNEVFNVARFNPIKD